MNSAYQWKKTGYQLINAGHQCINVASQLINASHQCINDASQLVNAGHHWKYSISGNRYLKDLKTLPDVFLEPQRQFLITNQYLFINLKILKL